MKDIIRTAISHFFIICVCIMFFTALINLLFGAGALLSDNAYPWSYPWIIMLSGFLGALPTLLFYFKKEPTNKQFLVRCIIHYFVLNALIISEGFMISWFDKPLDVLIVWLVITVIYVVVWTVTLLSNRSIKKGVNTALEKFNEDEG